MTHPVEESVSLPHHELGCEAVLAESGRDYERAAVLYAEASRLARVASEKNSYRASAARCRELAENEGEPR